jgi:hypothetical protein
MRLPLEKRGEAALWGLVNGLGAALGLPVLGLESLCGALLGISAEGAFPIDAVGLDGRR